MKSMNQIKKWIIGLTLTSSFFVLAHSVLDNAKFYDLNFISEDEVVFESNINDSRIVASNDEIVNTPAILKVSKKALRNINQNNWEIVRITNSNGFVFYDKNIGGDQTSEIIVKLESLNSYKLRLNDDESLEYYISYYQKTTLALFHQVNNIYEIIELKRKGQSNIVITTSSSKEEVVKSQKPKGMIFNSEDELLAYSGVDPSRSRRALLASQMKGSIEVIDGEISVTDLVLHSGEQNETESVSFSARILDGGVIRYSDNATGMMANAILMNNGENGFTIRFTSGGPLKGALVNFFTSEEIDKKDRVAELQQERNQVRDQDILNNLEDEQNKRSIASNQWQEQKDDELIENNENHQQDEGQAGGFEF